MMLCRGTNTFNLAVTGVLHGLHHIYSIFLSPLNEEIRQYFGKASISAITSFKTTYLITFALSNLLFGALSNKLSPKKTLLFGSLLNSLAILGFTLVSPEDFWVMHLLWMISALGAGTYHPISFALIMSSFPNKKGWAIGINGIGGTIGLALSPLITGVLSRTFKINWQQISLVFVLLGVLSSLLVVFLFNDPEKRMDTCGTGKGLKSPDISLKRSALLFIGFIFVASGLREFVQWSIIDISDFFLSKLNVNQIDASWCLFAMYLPGIVIQPTIGAISDKYGRQKLAALSLSVYMVAIVLLTINSKSFLLVIFTIMGLGYTSSVPLIEAMVGDWTSQHLRALVFGIMISTSIGIASVGPVLSGLIIDSNGGTLGAFKVCFLVLGGLAEIAVVIVTFSGLVVKKLHL